MSEVVRPSPEGAPLAVPSPPGALARPLARPGLFAGLGSLLGGFGFVVGRPSVWPLALVPVLVAGLVGVGLATLSVWLLPPKLVGWIGATSALGTVAAWLLGVLATVVAVAVSLVAGLAVAQPLSGPALDAIVRRVEADLGAPVWPRRRFVDDFVRGLGSFALASAFGLPVLALLFAVNFAFPPAVVVTFPLKILVCALLVAWDLCDYPLSLRGVPLRARIAFARRHALALAGFGVCLALLSVVLPFALLLVLPAGVAGAARLTTLLERWDEAQGRRLR